MIGFRHEILAERTLAGAWRAIPEEPLAISKLLEEVRQGKEPKNKLLHEIFAQLFFTHRTPSPLDLNSMDIMVTGIQTGVLECQQEFVALPPVIPDEPTPQKQWRGRVVESNEHKAMKQWVRQYLLASGIAVSSDEISMLGYEVDVGCLKSNVYVECGDTEPRKVLEFLRNGLRIGILQYYSENILWFIGSEKFLELAAMEKFL